MFFFLSSLLRRVLCSVFIFCFMNEPRMVPLFHRWWPGRQRAFTRWSVSTRLQRRAKSRPSRRSTFPLQLCRHLRSAWWRTSVSAPFWRCWCRGINSPTRPLCRKHSRRLVNGIYHEYVSNHALRSSPIKYKFIKTQDQGRVKCVRILI